MRIRLIPVDGGKPIELAKDLILIGRNDDADLRIDHKSISKLHCILVRGEGIVLARDLGSTNGTRVNGQRVRRAAVLPNDIVSFANFRYRLKVGEEPDPSESPEASDHHPIDVVDDLQDMQPPDTNLPRKPGEPPLKRNILPDVYPTESQGK
ncbi:MAG: FHA domain-containing protein [Bacteroidales bacterium]|nr:FHA domain-containing protein [Bacteroidales bacterium]